MKSQRTQVAVVGFVVAIFVDVAAPAAVAIAVAAVAAADEERTQQS